MTGSAGDPGPGVLQRCRASATFANFGHLASFTAVITASALAARWLGIVNVEYSTVYGFGATALLCVGLYASTSSIDIDEARGDAKLVLLAVTAGVLAKTAIIAGVMYAVFRRPEMIILGVAVAQIDPLSVAAIRRRSRLSPRASTILSAWSSFDDPITALMTVYLAALLATQTSTGILDPVFGASVTVAQLLLNVVLVVAALALWRLTGGRDRGGPQAGARFAAQRVLLVGFAAAAILRALVLAIAFIGLFFRPGISRFVEWATRSAFWLAAIAIGIAMGDGVDLLGGLVLGTSAYGAQVVVGSVITVRLPRNDRIDLALGQQNGITAVILALLLEPAFPGTCAVVGPAIVVVNLLHGIANTIWVRGRPTAEPTPSRSTGSRAQAAA